MPSTLTESNTTTATPTIATAPETKSPLLKATNTELTSTQLYIEGTVITNDTHLAFQEHKVQQLISKQIDLEYGVSDILVMITLIIALGSMMFSMIANKISSEANLARKDIVSIVVAFTILLGCLGYGIYGECKKRADQKIIQMEIVNTINAIDTYKKEKK